VEDKDGRVWIASERAGLLHLDEKKNVFVSFFNDKDGGKLEDTPVISLCPDKGNRLWVGTTIGLFDLDTKTGAALLYTHDAENSNSIAGNYVEDIIVDRNENLWIATHENGLDKLVNRNGENKTFVHYRSRLDDIHSLTNNDVTTVYEDSAGKIWVCNENGGLHLYNPANDNFFRFVPDPADPFSVSNISVKVIFEDRQGRLWVGSNLEGIDVVDKYEFRFDHYYQTNDFQSINNNIVRSFLEDDDGNVWIATDGGGLNLFNRPLNKFEAFKHDPHNPQSLNSNAVLTLCNDKDGKMWIGTWRGGINIFDYKKRTFSSFAPDLYQISKVFYIKRDRHDNMWIGTQSGGISKYDWATKKISTFTNKPHDSKSLGDNEVPIIFEDSEGQIWLGTEFNGLNRVVQAASGVTFERFTHVVNDTMSIPNSRVNHIYEDSKKNLWIATEGGLSRFLKETGYFKNYSIHDGLESDHIKSIVEDDHGVLWLGTSKGISRFDPVKETFRNYTYNDGLQRGEFSRYSVYKTKKGELLFGGTNGFNIFHPDSINDNPFAPPVYITGLRIFNKPVQIGDNNSPLSQHISETTELTLSYKESVFSFDFVGLNFTHPHMNQYAYKMEGFEKDWNYVGSQRTATYTSLDPGEYTFRVKASNNDGLWNEEGTSLRIIITPPFWRTAWFLTLVVIVLCGLLYSAVYYRVRRLHEINLELEDKVSERTSQLKGLITELQEKKTEIEESNSALKKTHKELESINDQLDKRVYERTAKLVNANQQLDRFVYSASHDLSAPLKSILGLINLLKLENHSTALLQHLKFMENSVVKLEVVIDHLTNFSRNQSPVTNSQFSFSSIVDEVLDDLKYFSNEKNLKIQKCYKETDALTSDFLRIKIILANLISNAIKYRDSSKAENLIRIKFKRNGSASIIEVEDNGIGIPDEYQEKIFDMFFRATTKSEGSGLGLFIVKDIVEKLHGKISITSQPDGTTNFTIVLSDQG
jgi:ligand-binding sensor domain-containing protein/signal transduction histidine kinase